MLEVKFRRIFACESCEGSPTFEAEDFIAHAAQVHGISKLKGTKQMVMHLDGSGWYTSVYDWQVGDLKFTETVTGGR